LTKSDTYHSPSFEVRMEFSSAVSIPERPGKTSMWTAFRPERKARDSQGGRGPATHPASPSIGSLDAVRAAFWQSYRHLFPPHSLAAQTSNGSVVISWSVMDDPSARFPYAAPVMLRFEQDLVDLMWNSDPRQRRRIAENHEATLREGLRGYDPYASIPNARIIVLG
jgi:hypothetical protein